MQISLWHQTRNRPMPLTRPSLKRRRAFQTVAKIYLSEKKYFGVRCTLNHVVIHVVFVVVEVLLKAAGDAPIMVKKKWVVDGSKQVSYIIEFIRKYIKCEQQDSLVSWRRMVFSSCSNPGPYKLIKIKYQKPKWSINITYSSPYQLSERSVWENFNWGHEYRLNAVRSVLKTEVKNLPYRPTELS